MGELTVTTSRASTRPSLYPVQPASAKANSMNTSTIAGRAALAKKRKPSTSARGKTSSKKTKASSKRASQVEEEGPADIV